MRNSRNPNKNIKLPKSKFIHRIIIPVHISDNEYSKDLLKILKICLKSLIKTIHKKTAISVVNNGSNKEVAHYLNQLFEIGVINELIHISTVGKVNAILKVLRAADEELITITDADVLFLNGWQDKTIQVFSEFKKAGVVGIVPQFKLYSTNSYNLLFDNLLSSKLKFTDVKDSEGLKKFYKSIGWDNDYNKDYLKTNLTLQSENGSRAIVGSGHFVASYRKEVFEFMPKDNSEYLLGGGSINKYFDLPVLKVDGWRLTTENNYAYHMGNVYEDWMNEAVDGINDESKREIIAFNEVMNTNTSKLFYVIKNHLFRKLLSNKSIFKKLLTYKGLDKDMLGNY